MHRFVTVRNFEAEQRFVEGFIESKVLHYYFANWRTFDHPIVFDLHQVVRLGVDPDRKLMSVPVSPQSLRHCDRPASWRQAPCLAWYRAT